jgi:hypothetical protein
MKKINILLFIIFVATSLIARNPAFVENSQKEWVRVTNPDKPAAIELFQLKDNKMTICSGYAGYIRTKKKYSDFTLSVDWRWLGEKGNSGVLVHIQAKDTVWPKCYQAQLKTGAAGDLICMNGLWAKECTDTIKQTVLKKLPSNEKKPGTWNNMLIISKKGTLKIYVNGILQNEVTGLTAKKGYIGFQAEGQAMEFTNLIIK